jgi:hypothetical protein
LYHITYEKKIKGSKKLSFPFRFIVRFLFLNSKNNRLTGV